MSDDSTRPAPDGDRVPLEPPSAAESVGAALGSAARRAGLDPARVTPHVMRHTAITRLVKAGIDLPTIQKISGHKTLAMVMRYVHIHGAHIDAAIATLNVPITHELQI